jgi:hypothetical protein
MLILPGALPVAPIPDQAFIPAQAPSQVNIVTAAAATSKTRNETGADTGPHAGGQHLKKPKPFPDMDKPTGPPPTFEANLLETEREKQRAGPEIMNETPKLKEAEPQNSYYAKAPEPENHAVDITL